MSETRVFTNVGTFTLAYDYNLAGQLKKITDASNTTINYGYDRVGRLTGVTGSDTLVAGVSTYASGFQYRAWGALKQVAIGTRTSSFSYNSVLRPTNFNISGGVVNQNYEYYSDGHLSFVHNTTDNNFDRAFTYDHAGRLTLAVSGGAARNDTGSIPMYETFSHDAFDNVTNRDTDTWSDSYSDGASYTNHRRSGWGYDANGSVTTIDRRTYSYNAAGLLISLGGQQWTPNGYVPTTTASGFDGNGQKVREESPSGSGFITYYLRSTVLGGAILEELNSSGQKQIGYVYTPSGNALATQVPGQNEVRLKQVSPIGQSQYEFYTSNGDIVRQEFDPLGADMRLHSGPPGHGGAAGDINEFGPMGSRSGAIDNPAAGCTWDGVWVPCSMAFRALGEGAAVQCPDNDCGPQARWVVTDEGKKVPFLTLPFMAFANGESGYYIPGWVGATPQAQADAGPALRAVASGAATGWSIDSPFTQDPVVVNGHIIDDPQTPCHIMADVAQNEADTALMQNPKNDAAALAQFDRTFSTLYVGGPFTDSYQASRWRGGDGRTINPNFPFTGGDGFRNKYKDSGTNANPLIAGPKADQTHHYAAYQSLGINDVVFATTYGILREDNQGDLNLSRAAYRIGSRLRDKPFDLRNIGVIIRRTICSGPGHGLYTN